MTKAPPTIPAPPTHRVRWLPWLILLPILLAYSNTFSAPFIFDDHDSIVTNPHIRRLWPIWEAMRTPKYSTVSRRPIVCLTLALNYAVGQLHVRATTRSIS